VLAREDRQTAISIRERSSAFVLKTHPFIPTSRRLIIVLSAAAVFDGRSFPRYRASDSTRRLAGSPVANNRQRARALTLNAIDNASGALCRGTRGKPVTSVRTIGVPPARDTRYTANRRRAGFNGHPRSVEIRGRAAILRARAARLKAARIAARLSHIGSLA